MSGQPVLIVAGPGAGKVHVVNDADVAARRFLVQVEPEVSLSALEEFPPPDSVFVRRLLYVMVELRPGDDDRDRRGALVAVPEELRERFEAMLSERGGVRSLPSNETIACVIGMIDTIFALARASGCVVGA